MDQNQYIIEFIGTKDLNNQHILNNKLAIPNLSQETQNHQAFIESTISATTQCNFTLSDQHVKIARLVQKHSGSIRLKARRKTVTYEES